MTEARLPDADWRHRPGLDRLLLALGAADGEARFVGGAVRDSLLGQNVVDVDIATVHLPEEVIKRLKAAGIKAVPTGIAHGTITAVLDGWPAEITTLRRDVSTDGRRATVAFTTDWHEDAARRDFTMNALYADPLTSAVHDYFDGVADLHDGRVRFIGKAEDRIAEDHLRILRYFRFLARFGTGVPDVQAYGACKGMANSLMALSRERIADELLKLLGTTDPVPALRLMVEGEILLPVLPEIDAEGVERLATLLAREAATGIAGAPLRHLCALLPPDAAIGDAVAARLKLSNKARKRIATALSPMADFPTAKALAYRVGMEGALDRLLLAPDVDPQIVTTVASWRPPHFPITGAALIKRGLTPGPDVARALHAVEDQWVAEGFPDADSVDRIADQIVSKFQRARQ
jgi:poly(A) polymerase